MADHGIDECVDHQRDADRKPNQNAGQMHHLVVEEEKNGLETVVLDAERHRTQSVKNLGAQTGELACDFAIGQRCVHSSPLESLCRSQFSPMHLLSTANGVMLLTQCSR